MTKMKFKPHTMTIRLDPTVWEQLRTAMFQRERKANYLIGMALRAYLSIRKEPAKEAVRNHD